MSVCIAGHFDGLVVILNCIAVSNRESNNTATLETGVVLYSISICTVANSSIVESIRLNTSLSFTTWEYCSKRVLRTLKCVKILVKILAWWYHEIFDIKCKMIIIVLPNGSKSYIFERALFISNY